MISNTHRFHGRSSLRFVYQRGQTIRGQLVSLKYIHNDRQPNYRVAVVVSRKVSKSAVVRNRIRRRLYEIVRTNSKLISEPYDLVFTVYSEEASKISSSNLKNIVLSTLNKAGVLGDTSAPGAEHGILDKKETRI